ncbi:MAG TPA: hypothetical protein VKX49_17965 [Bryobacteraceae bacterium]|nr:hypothetical protein [Bryobacteraceae bacterium]
MTNDLKASASAPCVTDAPVVRAERFLRLRINDLLAVFGVVVCFAVVGMLPIAAKKFGDIEFHLEAKNVALALHGVNPEPVSIIRAPGPVLYYTVPYFFVPAGASDDTYWRAALIWAVLCMIAAVFWIKGAARRLFGEAAETSALLLLLATPFWAYYSFGINGEAMAFMGAALLLYGWSLWRTGTPSRAGALTAVAIGLVLFILSKPSALGLTGLAAISAGVLWWRGPRKQAAFAILCALVIVCTSLASSFALQHFERPDYRPAQVLYFRWTAFMGSFQMRSEPWDWRFWDDTTRAGSADYANFASQLAELRGQAIRTRYSVFDLEWWWVINDFKSHPFLRAKIALVRALFMHVNLVNSVRPSQFHLGPFRGRAGYIFVHVCLNLVYLMLIASSLLFLIAKRRQFFEYWILWGPWLALLAFHAVFYAEARYLFPIQPALILMTSGLFAERLSRVSLPSQC